ncbi:hypothetical protein GGF46_005068 [Coemansia sp. RSA 552]|nr:hypothetical protein GGF46_005068 [Coemansia sp. RSA 552]
MSTMGELHSLIASPATSPASAPVDDNPSLYPPTWHEYEDQFNYFYSCHFIEQNYYGHLAGHLRQPSASYPDISSLDDDGRGSASYSGSSADFDDDGSSQRRQSASASLDGTDSEQDEPAVSTV